MRPEKAPEISCFESLWTSPSTVSMLSLLMCTRHASHVTRVVTWITAVTTCYYCYISSLGQTVEGFFDLESTVFSGSTRLLWIRVSPGSTVVVPALRVKMTFMRIQNDIHVEMALILTHLSANQISVFSITQHSR